MSDEVDSAVSRLPPELQSVVFSRLPPDLQELCSRGSLVVTASRTLTLPPATRLHCILVGGGGRGVR